MRNHVEQLKEFDTNVKEITDWLQDVESKFEAESGLKATIGLKKSQYNAFQVGNVKHRDMFYRNLLFKAKLIVLLEEKLSKTLVIKACISHPKNKQLKGWEALKVSNAETSI